MRILVVNVNTTESITQAIARQAQAVAAPGTEIVGLTPHFGADSIEGNFESYLAAIAVMDRVMSYDQPFDAVIQAGYGEHGREGLQELLNVPVVDITDAGASTAMFLGHAYSVVTTLDRTVPLIEDRLSCPACSTAAPRYGPVAWRCWNWSKTRNGQLKPSCSRPSWRSARTRPK